MPPPERGQGTIGLLLAGGRARRMGGGDKCLRELGGRTLLTRIVERAGPQVDRLVLNANGDPDRFSSYGLPVVADEVEGFAGPLAGILAGLRWAAANAPSARWLASFPTDSPFLPRNMAARFVAEAERQRARLACAMSGGRTHPVAGLWQVALADDLEAALRAGERKIDAWTARHPLALVEWPDRPVDPFFNANTPDDLAAAEALLAQTTEVRSQASE